ncbi:hypothetical protein FZEAL_7662 [Fusarium zealandicum]|uniref:Uncharacterized protein n=1 Tax=Fusarium zealandicum TaxID=1053134 RepID=A0A8H4UFK2_9HYPO|nr:hypothetical protein FZEAL_7662 [Fusarium zealandicum]
MSVTGVSYVFVASHARTTIDEQVQSNCSQPNTTLLAEHWLESKICFDTEATTTILMTRGYKPARAGRMSTIVDESGEEFMSDASPALTEDSQAYSFVAIVISQYFGLSSIPKRTCIVERRGFQDDLVYTVHPRRPILPNTPNDLAVRVTSSHQGLVEVHLAIVGGLDSRHPLLPSRSLDRFRRELPRASGDWRIFVQVEDSMHGQWLAAAIQSQLEAIRSPHDPMDTNVDDMGWVPEAHWPSCQVALKYRRTGTRCKRSASVMPASPD